MDSSVANKGLMIYLAAVAVVGIRVRPRHVFAEDRLRVARA